MKTLQKYGAFSALYMAAAYCPGDVCAVKAKQAIQKTSLLQIGVVIGFIAFVITIAIPFNDRFSSKPTELWVIVNSILYA